MLTQARLKELLHYDPETGISTWISMRAGVRFGAAAGTLTKIGYIVVKVDGIDYGVHRLAWLYMTGNFPVDRIDHKNGNGSDNRFSNLRKANARINGENIRKARKHNKTGVLGVSHNFKKFQARITVKGKQMYLGNFKTPELAHAAYLKAKRALHEGCTI